ncbi:NAD(P)-binding domain-containing protein [Streptomyces sp. NPDC048483]|uniref:NADPH-dependent F420 reductase n=1 Tax=Streptomyces sp. NPDC048483 TaxID=3154927 RepID=UPI003420A429
MRIGILGTGGMADALGTQWARAGHELMVGGRSADRAAALAARLGPTARTGSWSEAAGFGEAVLLAVSHPAVPEVLAAAGPEALGGRVLIDCTNAIVEGFRLEHRDGVSMAERIARIATGARVVKAFHHCHEDVWRMRPPAFDGEPLAVPLCGDDPDALATVGALVRDLGCEPVAAGGLERAGLVEAMTALLVGLWVGGEDPRAMLPPKAFAFGG